MSAPHLLPRSIAIGITLCLVAIGSVPSPISQSVAAEPAAEWDGLARVKSKQLDHVYALPGATLAGYERVRLDPVEVAFDKNWQPNASGTRLSRRLSNDDLEKIKTTLASEFRTVFAAELGKSGFTLVDENGDDVLRVSAAIIDLYITAPDKPTAGRSRTYVASAGRMRLVAELRDSVTGQLLVRAVDTVQARQTANFEVTNSVTNLSAARTAMTKWGDVLRNGLDDANVPHATNSDVKSGNP
jgi:hypothetical protein